MTEATPAERRQAYGLFSQLIEKTLAKQLSLNANQYPDELARSVTRAIWPYVSADDDTILDATLMVTVLRDGALNRKLDRHQIVAKCDELLERLRVNPKDG